MTSEFPSPDPFEDSQQQETEQRATRRGRARERQRRRRERQMGKEDTTPIRTDHLAPVKKIQLDVADIAKSPMLRWGIGIVLAVVVVVGVILGLREIKPPEPEVQPNAIWIGTEWTYELHEPAAVDSLAEQLRANDIGAVYAWVSWLQEDGTWRGAENFTRVREFTNQLKEAYPEVILYGWLGFPVDLADDGYRLDDEELQQSIADFSASVVAELGFDGVFLNVEPVWDGDESYLDLLRKVRASVGDTVPISSAIPPDWSPEDADIPVPPLIVPGTIWSKEYKQSVALLSDEMAVMAYNSGLTSAEDYVEWMAYQVAIFAEAVSELGEGTTVMIGIPTYDDQLPGHDTTVENVVSALEGFDLGLAQAGDAASYVSGVAIYAGWTTDDTEWSQFNDWLARR